MVGEGPGSTGRKAAIYGETGVPGGGEQEGVVDWEVGGDERRNCGTEEGDWARGRGDSSARRWWWRRGG